MGQSRYTTQTEASKLSTRTHETRGMVVHDKGIPRWRLDHFSASDLERCYTNNRIGFNNDPTFKVYWHTNKDILFSQIHGLNLEASLSGTHYSTELIVAVAAMLQVLHNTGRILSTPSASMAMKEFKIQLDNRESAYYSGQVVSGRVVLAIDSEERMRGIKLEINGQANTRFSGHAKRLNNRGKYVYEITMLTGYEEVLNSSFYLIGSSSGEMLLAPGIHTYTFTYALPPDLPSSFESDFGSIRYTAKAIVDRPWRLDKKTELAFTVISSFDLNSYQSASFPVHLEASKHFCCLCCGSPPLSINISLPVRGFVPGQTIPIRVNVDNESGKRVNTVELNFQKAICYSSTSPETCKHFVTETIANVSNGPFEGKETTSYEQTLVVPPVLPSNCNGCRIIHFEYQLEVVARVAGIFNVNLTESTNIYIGTVPLSSYHVPQPPVAGVQPSIPHPSAPVETFVNQHQALNPYPNAPPDYAETMFGGPGTPRDQNGPEYIKKTGQPLAPPYPVL